MKKRLLSILLAICMVVTMAPAVFAKTFDYEDLPDYLAEQDQGLYIAAQRITESGYYLLTRWLQVQQMATLRLAQKERARAITMSMWIWIASRSR